MLCRTLSLSPLFLAALLFAAPSPAAALAIDWVTVGDPGNACESQSAGCFGAVAKRYRISRFEITNAEYAEFLNAVATTDTHELYNPNMATALFDGGITRSGSAESFGYSALPGREDLPVNWVTFWDAVRFANWLHNGQPTGIQDDTTTEDGAYTLTPAGIADNTVVRNPGATVFLPSADEWYKAAYYDATSGGYFDYPAGSDTPTTCEPPGATPNTANCSSVEDELTAVGSYSGSAGPHGTFDQGGNAFEWLDDIFSNPSDTFRRTAFSSFRSLASNLAAAGALGTFEPSRDHPTFGFRVASSSSTLDIGPVGSEFQVNTITANGQGGPSVAADDAGEFVVTWTSVGSYYSYIQGQRFDASGAMLGSEFEISGVGYLSDRGYYDGSGSEVAIDANDNFIVVWVTRKSLTGVIGQRLDRNGIPLGFPFSVDIQRNPAPDVVADLSGGFVVVWNTSGIYDVLGRRYDSNGALTGSEFVVSTYTTGYQERPSIARDAAGTFVVTFTHTGYDENLFATDDCDILGQRLDTNGLPFGVAFQVNSYTTGCQDDSSVAVREDGSFVVVWNSEGSAGSDDSESSVQAQLFDPSAQPFGSEFQVNVYTTGFQSPRPRNAVALTPDGGFLVSWTSSESDGSDDDATSLRARLFDAEGGAIGVEFQVNTYTTGYQSSGALASTPDGSVIATWSSSGSNGSDDSGSSVQAQRFAVPEPTRASATAAALVVLLLLARRRSELELWR